MTNVSTVFSSHPVGCVCDSYTAALYEPDCSLTVVSCQKPDVAGLVAVERSELELLPVLKISARRCAAASALLTFLGHSIKQGHEETRNPD